jgi:hypothetical protein
MQRVGRIRRPWSLGFPEYVSGCHNLLRHGYLFENLMPSSAYKEARTVWGSSFKPSRRIMARALGASGFGRFEPAEIPLANGETAYLYCLQADSLRSYAALMLPSDPMPRYYKREDGFTGEMASFSKPQTSRIMGAAAEVDGSWVRADSGVQLREMLGDQTPTLYRVSANGGRGAEGKTLEEAIANLPPLPPLEIPYREKKRGKWERITELPDLVGSVSYPSDSAGPGALDWWRNSAPYYGLDAANEPSRKAFQILPILKDAGGF